jgi:hypothetical protein
LAAVVVAVAVAGRRATSPSQANMMGRTLIALKPVDIVIRIAHGCVVCRRIRRLRRLLLRRRRSDRTSNRSGGDMRVVCVVRGLCVRGLCVLEVVRELLEGIVERLRQSQFLCSQTDTTR